jgi:hypothetical protein
MALVLVGLLAWGGYALFQGGYAQGYQAALMAHSGANGDVPAQPAYGYLPAWGWFGAPFFHPFGWLFGIGFFLFIFFVIGGLFRFGGRRYYGGGPGHWGHGPDPEFMKEWEARYKERVEKEKGPGVEQ